MGFCDRRRNIGGTLEMNRCFDGLIFEHSVHVLVDELAR